MTLRETRALDTWRPDELENVIRCPFCGCRERITLYEDLEDRWFASRGRWRLRQCLECGGGYLDPRPREDLIGRAYEEYYTHGEGEDVDATKTLRAFRRAVQNGYLNSALGYRFEPTVPMAALILAPFRSRRRHTGLIVRDLRRRQNGRLLDLGCGRGHFLRTMRAAGWRVEGVEPDSHAAAAARASGLLVHEGTLEDARLSASTFDAITMNHVLEHLPAPVDVLERCRMLLRDDGVLWSATPNLASPGHARYGRDWVGLADIPRHLALSTPRSLERLMSKAGFHFELLHSSRAGWWLAASERLRDARLNKNPGTRRRLRLGMEARLQDLQLRRGPHFGEELIVVARPVRA